MRSLLCPLALILALPACSTGGSSFEGPTGKLIESAAAEAHVPADLMAAIAHVEGGLRMAKLQDRMDPEWIVGLRLAKDEGLLYPGEDGFYAGYAPARILRLAKHPYNLEMWRRLPPD